MAYPPVPVFPEAIDSDYTLFLVYNTTETKLAVENSPWAREIDIVPRTAAQTEIWGENGFGNISGELFYYDSVEKNNDGRVIKLKNCARQLGGEATKYNKQGTWVRSYVVAEHHNQIVQCMLQTEDFVGYNYDTRQATLDWRIRNLEELDIIFDDYNCPDVVFSFTVIEDSATTGILAEYYLEISPPGQIYNFRIDFGDGEYTTTDISGQHRYAINARVDPVLTIASEKCEIVQTPMERPTPGPLPQIDEQILTIPIPELPDCPDFTVVPCDVPELDITIPPLVMPCVEAGSDISIEGPGINLVSQVTITGPDNPVQILYDTVTITGGDNIPNIINIDPPIPPTIIIDPPIPPTIVIVPPQSEITLSLNSEDLPRLEVDWGPVPRMDVNLAMVRPVRPARRLTADAEIADEFGAEFADLFEESSKTEVEYESVGIPEEIKIIAPDSFPAIDFNVGQIPKEIALILQGPQIPSDINVRLEKPIPSSITIDGMRIPDVVRVVNENVPETITVKSDIPREIEFKGVDHIPTEIAVRLIEPFPTSIPVTWEGPDSLKVTGIPNTLEVTGFPEGIPLLPPTSMPPVEMVYNGAPIELKINMDEVVNKTADRSNCVMITPCPG